MDFDNDNELQDFNEEENDLQEPEQTGSENGGSEADREKRDLEKREKFIEVAEPRVDAAIRKIRSIGKLSNRSYYQFDEKQVNQLLESLENAVQEVRKKFQGEKIEKFSFKD